MQFHHIEFIYKAQQWQGNKSVEGNWLLIVGSDTGVITPILTILSNSLLTHSSIARGTLRGGLTTGVELGSSLIL